MITLREADHWPLRNSNLEAWIKFAHYLRNRGEDVVFIRDTKKADESIEGFPIWPEAATDLYLRMAAYQEAKANVMVSNGPIGLCLFSTAPWLQFVQVEKAQGEYEPNTSFFWKNSNGVKIGEQYPWATPNQRIWWDTDSYENLVKAWESYFPSLMRRAA